MKEVAGKRRRFGYRRIGIMLERQGMIMNHKKLYRLYREEGLSVRRRRGRKRARAAARRCLCRWLRALAGRWTSCRIRSAHRASSGSGDQ
jgi:putative transposase